MKFVRIISIILLLTGCLNQPDCLITSTNLVTIAFKNATDAAQQITFDSISVSGLSKTYYQNTEASSVVLPLTPEEKEITITFSFEDRVETLRLSYNTRAEIISADCGAFTKYVDLEVADTSFDLYSVVNNQLSINVVNLEIRID